MAHDSVNVPLFISTLNPKVFPALNTGTLAEGSVTWATANAGIVIPFKLPWEYTIARVFWVNGSAAGGNWNLGVFDATCATRYFATGSTGGSGNSAPQFVAVAATLPADTELNLVLVHDGTTANRVTGQTVVTAGPTTKLNDLQVLEATNQFALTAPLTLTSTASTILPLCGFTRTASGF